MSVNPAGSSRPNATGLNEGDLFDYVFRLKELQQMPQASTLRKEDKNECCRTLLIIIAIITCAVIISGAIAVVVILHIDYSHRGKHKSITITNLSLIHISEPTRPY